jgi:hypothetical protein
MAGTQRKATVNVLGVCRLKIYVDDKEDERTFFIISGNP